MPGRDLVKYILLSLLLLTTAPWLYAADVIHFTDGMKTVCQQRAWEENGEVKCEYGGTVISYSKKDVLRIEKNHTIPATTPLRSSRTVSKTVARPTPIAALPPKGSALLFYNPRRAKKYWTGGGAKYDTFKEAVAALAAQYHRSPQWVVAHMGNTNDLNEIHKNLRKGRLQNEKSTGAGAKSMPGAIVFYNPRRAKKYWVSRTLKYTTFHEAIAALASQYRRTPKWILAHMGNTNDLSEIHHNLQSSLSGPESP